MVPVLSLRTRRTVPRTHRTAHIVTSLLAVLAIILGIECGVMNIPYWRSIAASTDSTSYANTLGSGLTRLDSGMVRVTDPTQAYFEVHADGSSPYVHAQTVSDQTLQLAQHTDDTDTDTDTAVSTVYVRVSSPCGTSSTASVTPYASRSLYIATCPSGSRANGTVRVWIEEPIHTLIPITNMRANVHVPFSFSWLQIALMLIVVIAVVLFRPRSILWRTPLRTSSGWQRAIFAAIMTVGGIALIVSVVNTAIAHAGSSLVFHRDGNYTYDFEQYGHVADALLHGRTWLNLPVPNELAASANPYDPSIRKQLLDQGVSPIYWDYAFHDGHWYSYFGVIPAVLFFLPYQAVTSLFVEGGLMLPSTCAELIAMGIFTLFACLVVIRLVQRCASQTSLAATSLLCLAFLIGSNAPYLWYRTNFYSVPFATALMFTMIGVWLWLGADRTGQRNPHHGMWQIAGAPAISLAHVAGGALCIAATFGCRPTFALTALLAIPLFWPQIRACVHELKTSDRSIALHRVMQVLAAMFIPAALVVIPVCWYNVARFGSVFDFGNPYQITVTDMMAFRTPLSNLPATVFYYLLLPLRFQPQFPWLAISPTPMPVWSFTEPSVCGLFIMAPLVLLAFAVPWMRRQLNASGLYSTLTCGMVLAMVLLIFDSVVGGFGWRYIADFGWLFMMAATPVAAYLMRRHRTVRIIVVLAVAWMITISMLSAFVVGRDDALIANDPGFYHMIQAWFSLLS